MNGLARFWAWLGENTRSLAGLFFLLGAVGFLILGLVLGFMWLAEALEPNWGPRSTPP